MPLVLLGFYSLEVLVRGALVLLVFRPLLIGAFLACLFDDSRYGLTKDGLVSLGALMLTPVLFDVLWL